jgi:hypothetical protein
MPTDRSNPPTVITRVCAIAGISRNEKLRPRLIRFIRFRNRGSASAVQTTATTSSKMTMPPLDRKASSQLRRGAAASIGLAASEEGVGIGASSSRQWPK